MRTLLSSILLAATVGAAAQELRISGGYNGSNISEAGKEKWVGKAGYQFGADLLLGSRWFVKGGAHFMVRNISYSVATIDDQGNPTENVNEFRYTSQFLRVPIHGGFRFIDPKDEPVVNAYIMAGPTAQFRLNTKFEEDAVHVDTNPAHWYIGAGAGLQFGPVFIEGGYDVALTNEFKGVNTFNTNPKVNQIYALIGVRLKLAQD
ncbi:MAG: outer membrane beta-barrel protein [Flavobacteriales bacterium]